MKIEQNKVVEFSYELEVDGQVVDHTTKERPLDYIHGTGSLLPKLEEHIQGMEPGDKFEITLSPADGYGEVDQDRIIDLPKAAFEVNGEIREDLLVPGTTIPMLNSMGGVIPGVVLEVNGDNVKMDLNHRMAGKTLHFKGEVLSVREATEKELTEGLHGEYVHSCGCGGCGGHGHDGGCGCGDDCGCSDGCGCGCDEAEEGCGCDENCDCGCNEGKDCGCN